MGLNDEIGNFSKRREVETVSKKRDSHDEEDYDDWDDEEYEDDDNEYASYDFKLYSLDELEAFNEEVSELKELISPWWKNLRTIFSKSTFGKIGLIDYKKKHLLSDDTFSDVFIENVEESLRELAIFGKTLKKSYFRRFMSNVYGIIFYVGFAYWTGWNMIWYFLIGWSLYDMLMHYFKYGKQKAWLVKAETFINSQESAVNVQREESSTLDDVMAFNDFVAKEENEHWSIKVYDAIANLFTRKK